MPRRKERIIDVSSYAPLSKFNDTVLSVLDKHAPKKKEIHTFKQLQFYD